MAALTDGQRQEAWAGFMRDWAHADGPVPFNKAELRAAVDAVDAWVEANAASFNAAIPLPTRTRMTAKQKAKLLMAVVQKRFGVL